MGWSLGVFYVDDDLLVSREPEWIQVALNVLIRLFRRIGLAANVAKSKMITCQSGVIRLRMLEEAFGQCSTGEGATYQEQLKKKRPSQNSGWVLQQAT